MGHNKGWEEAASMFSGDSIVLKTCNAALLEAAGKSWVEVSIILITEHKLCFPVLTPCAYHHCGCQQCVNDYLTLISYILSTLMQNYK